MSRRFPREGRWQIGLVNWSHDQVEHPTVPHAVSYLSMPDGMLFEEYHRSHADAVAHVDRRIREHLERFTRIQRLHDERPAVIRDLSRRRWRNILGDQETDRYDQVERDNLIAVYTADGTEYDPDAQCECAMTEASHHACPVHGVNAPPEEIRSR